MISEIWINPNYINIPYFIINNDGTFIIKGEPYDFEVYADIDGEIWLRTLPTEDNEKQYFLTYHTEDNGSTDISEMDLILMINSAVSFADGVYIPDIDQKYANALTSVTGTWTNENNTIKSFTLASNGTCTAEDNNYIWQIRKITDNEIHISTVMQDTDEYSLDLIYYKENTQSDNAGKMRLYEMKITSGEEKTFKNMYLYQKENKKLPDEA